MPKITLGITGLHEILGRDYGIESMRWRWDAKNNPRDPGFPLFEARDSGF